jgi:polar amino acid transport system permease protein
MARESAWLGSLRETPVELFLENFANFESLQRIYPLLLQGLQVTALLAIVTLPIAVAVGLLIGVLYSFHHRWLNVGLIVWIDLLRSFPVLVLLILIFYGLPFLGLTLGNFSAVVAALVLNNSGYYGEIFRAGIEAIPKGQREAAQALGLGRLQTVFLVILPQALRNVLAPLASNSLELVKTTSIAALVALPELLRSARVAQEQTYNPTPLTAAAVIFFVLLWPFARLVGRLEREMLARSR